MGVEVDVSEFRALSVDLGRAAGRVVADVESVMERGALGVKSAMVEDAKAHTGHAKHFHRSISYDRAPGIGSITYEIGPDKGRTQGALGNLLYFGSVNNGPVLDVEAGLTAEAPLIEKHLLKIVEGVLDE